MAGSTIKPCKCTSKFQDETYGKGKRLFTVGEKDLRCTVCGNSDKKDK